MKNFWGTARVISFMALSVISWPAQSQPAEGSAAAEAKVVDPDAVDALKRMSAFLGSLDTFRLTANSTRDVVTNDGQRVQMDSVTNYTARKAGFVIDIQNDLKPRRYVYDGKKFTVSAPNLGFYSTIDAPPTTREMLDLLYVEYGLEIPLEDLFRWNEPGWARHDKLTSGYSLGTATIEGAATDHYVFRQGDLDWEIWIEQGARPIPRKITIVDRTDTALPAFTARLAWTLNPAIAANEFAFTPAANGKRISMATLRSSPADGSTSK